LEQDSDSCGGNMTRCSCDPVRGDLGQTFA